MKILPINQYITFQFVYNSSDITYRSLGYLN